MRETNIEWTDSTVNLSSGCDGCELWGAKAKTCYAGTMHEKRLALAMPKLYAPSFSEVRMIPGRLAQAANWPDLRGKPRAGKPWLDGRPRHIFVGDMGDFLSAAITDQYLESELLRAITSTNGKRHVWQLLTKRPRRLAELSRKWGCLPDNVIAMTTVTDQRTANRIDDLLEVKCRWRGLSLEPMLGPVDLSEWVVCPNARDGLIMDPDTGAYECCRKCDFTGFTGAIDWVIVGGESGPGARPMQPEWILALRDQCASADVPFFFKQWGHWIPRIETPSGGSLAFSVIEWDRVKRGEYIAQMSFAAVGKADAGRMLDSMTHSGMPEVLVV